MENFQITSWCHHFIKEQVKPGDICIDATAGNGNDTEFLLKLTGPLGKVYAFDIQETALRNTKKRIAELPNADRVTLILDSHTRMRDYVMEDAACIVFNFGYLPGGDHTLSTKASTSIEALEEGLLLLKKGGMMSLCIYSGGDSGFEERDTILAWLSKLSPERYLVIVSQYFNRPNHPPIPVFLTRIR